MDPTRPIEGDPGTSRVPEEQRYDVAEPSSRQPPPQEMPEWMRPFMAQIQSLAAQVRELQVERVVK